MPCTDQLAGHWSLLVVEPAITNGDVLRPLEALKRLRDIDWESVGMCKECIEFKRTEWKEQAKEIWGRIGDWLGLEAAKEVRRENRDHAQINAQ